MERDYLNFIPALPNKGILQHGPNIPTHNIAHNIVLLFGKVKQKGITHDS